MSRPPDANEAAGPDLGPYPDRGAGGSRALSSPFDGRGIADCDAPGAGAPPRARDLAGVLLLVFALQLLTLSMVEGYQIADSVEYLDRADLYAQGQALDPGTVRSFAFSALFLPLFLVARVLGAESFWLCVTLARLMVMAMGLAAVLVTARIGWRIGGRRAGFAAAFLAGVNPVLLQHTVEPLSGAAAMLCVALAADRLLRPGGWRGGLVGGVWLGLGVLMAFKTLLIAGSLLLFLGLRERWRGRRLVLGAGLGLAACMLVQCVLDLLVYGSFGASLLNYVGENALTQGGALLYKLGFRESGKWLYDLAQFEVSFAARADGNMASRTSPAWYFVNMRGSFLVIPAMLCVALGIGRALRRPRWSTTLVLGALALAITVMSVKGAKSFRLWLPMLPLVAALGGLGWVSLRGPLRGARLPRLRLLGGAALLAASAWQGVDLLRAANLAQHAGYWDAILVVNEHSHGAEVPQRCGSAYHWAVQYRESTDVDLVKLPHHLNQWENLEEAQREEVLEFLPTYDWFLGHEQVFTQDPILLAKVNEHFEIHSVVYDEASFGELEPIYVLRARSGSVGARTFFEVIEGADPAAVQASLQVPRSVDYRRWINGPEEVVNGGFDSGPGSPSGWSVHVGGAGADARVQVLEGELEVAHDRSGSAAIIVSQDDTISLTAGVKYRARATVRAQPHDPADATLQLSLDSTSPTASGDIAYATASSLPPSTGLTLEMAFTPTSSCEAHLALVSQNGSGATTVWDDVSVVEVKVDQIVLLGFDVEPVAEGELAWMTFHWFAGPTEDRDYTITYRVTDPRSVPLFQVNHEPTFGVYPTSTWEPGWIVRETILAKVPVAVDRGSFGGPYYRGQVVPCQLWLALAQWEHPVDPETGERIEDGTPRVVGGLSPFHASGSQPIHKATVDGWRQSRDGRRFSADNLYLAGGFHLPVPPRGHIPDDGNPLPNPSAAGDSR